MKRIGFVLVDGHALMSTAAALEPLRAANLFAGKTVYETEILSTSKSQVVSSLGSTFAATPISRAGLDFDIVFVVAGGNPVQLHEPALISWLRRASEQGTALGGISGGGVLLAKAGLMENRRFTVHWHHYEDIERMGRGLLMERRLFVIDRDRYSCAGGIAPLDMMHAIITREHGSEFANRIGDWFIQPEARNPTAPQKSSIQARYGPLTRPLSSALALMESHVADQLSPLQLASLSGLSTRQLQRQFQERFNTSMMEMYRTIRLNKAMDLLRQTAMPIAEIAHATGFSNQTHFSASFRKQFGISARNARKPDKKVLPLKHGLHDRALSEKRTALKE